MESSSSAALRFSPPDDADAYRELARRWAASVTVVTAVRRGDPARLDGFTATAFLTVSIAPPVLLVSAGNVTRAAELLTGADAFAVNLLSSTQRGLADAFARPYEQRGEVWRDVAWSPDAAGVPILHGALGAFSAVVRQLVVAGDHTVVFGDVTGLHRSDRGDPLVYHDRGYGVVQRH